MVERYECPSWRWDQRQWDPFMEQLDGVGMAELMRGKVPERTVVFTVRLPASLIAGVRGAAARSGGSLSATTAQALRAGLERVEGPRERSARGGAPR